MFICQGAIDPELTKMMQKQFPQGHPHSWTPEREALHAEAAKHPDEKDVEAAKKFAADVLKKIEAN